MPGIGTHIRVGRNQGGVGIPPTISGAIVADGTPNFVSITFLSDLDDTSVPATTAFTLAGKTITNVSIIGAVVTLTVSVDYVYGDVITVVYTQPVLNPLKALAGGGLVASFSQAVTNNIVISAPSGLASTVISGTQINLTFIGTGDVERSINGTDYTIIATNQTDSYSDTGLTAGNTYYHRIYNAGGYSNVTKRRISTALTSFLAGWKLNESSGNAIDVKGVYNLTNNNSVAYVAGIKDNAASLGASNTNKSLSIDNNFGLTYASARSIAGWFNIIDIPAGTGNFTFGLVDLMFATNPGNHTAITYRRVSNVLKLSLYTGDYSIALTPGTWYHIAVTWNHTGNVSKMYLNGVLIITSTSFSSDYSAQTTRFVIGNIVGASWASVIADDVYLWNRVLTLSEVNESYRSSYPFYNDSSIMLDLSSYCWFTSPRAIYNATANKTWGGIVHSEYPGHSQYIFTVDNVTELASAVRVGTVYEHDDHNEPSILVRASDNRLFTAYSEHSDPNGTLIRFRISTNALDASAWNAEGTIAPSGASTYSYCNVFQVTNGDIYIFFRETGVGDTWWNFIKSTDGGATFGDDTRIIHKPYVRCWQNPADKDIIHFAASFHPNQLTTTNIVTHCYFDAGDGTWHKSDGTDVTANIPLVDANLTTIFSNTDPEQGWIEDLFLDASGYPRVLMTYYPNIDTTPILKKLYYSEWTGTAWSTPHEIHESMNKNIGLVTLVNTYPSLASFDRANPNRIFASKEISGICEIFEITRVAANNFTSIQITNGSTYDQWRPFTVASPNRNVFWLNKIRYYSYLNDYNEQLFCKTL